ncbi:MAG: hypothetical protein IPK87_08560 [Planctomycetes bacterium]|nr:hypothetical protein [Planctomycetota bacterium]
MNRLILVILTVVAASTISAQGTTSLSASGNPPPAAVINAGTTDIPVLAFRLIRVQPNPPPVTLTGVSATMTGTAVAQDIVQWTLFEDTNSNDAYDVGVDQPVGTPALGLNPAFTGLSIGIPSPSQMTLFVMVDLSAAATPGATVSLQLLATGIATTGGGKNGGPVNSSIMTIANTASADINVQRNSTSIASGANDPLGNVLLGGQNFDYVIENVGGANLSLTGSPIVAIGNLSNCAVLEVQPAASVLIPAAQTLLSMTVTPQSATAFSFEISIANSDPDAGESPYVIFVSGTGLSPTATQLIITTQPGTGTGGSALSGQPVVEAQTSAAALDTGFNGLVTAQITASTGTSGALLLGTVALNAVGGIATFTDLAIDLVGTGYQLTFTSGSLTPDTSNAFDITLGSAAQIVVTAQPGNGTGGLPLSTQPSVEIHDAGGNLIASDNTTLVTAAITSGTGTGGAILSGTLTLQVISGAVAFTDLAIDRAATGYSLDFSAAGLTTGVSNTFDIAIGVPALLAVASNPGNGTGGLPLAQQPAVEVQDAGGNRITSDNATQVTATISTGSGGSGALLLGTATITAASGAVVFVDLAIDLAATGYTLDFDAAGLSGTTSTSFDITVGVAAQLAIVTQPGNGNPGAALIVQPAVAVQDAGGNTLLSDSLTLVTVAIAVGTGTSGAVLTGTVAVTVSSGVATFSGLGVDLAGVGYQLEFTSGALVPATSTNFDVTVPSSSSGGGKGKGDDEGCSTSEGTSLLLLLLLTAAGVAVGRRSRRA